MTVKYKFFSTLFKDVENNIQKLRETFPGCFFRNGKWSGESGVFILSHSDRSANDFKPPVKSKQFKNTLFFAPNDITDGETVLKSFRKHPHALTIKVKLANDKTIEIIPASAEPRKIALSLLGDDDSIGFTSDYGRLAWEIDEKLANQQSVAIADGLKLFILGVQKTYTIPIDLFNCFDLVSTEDIEQLTYACLGYNMSEDDKKKE